MGPSTIKNALNAFLDAVQPADVGDSLGVLVQRALDAYAYGRPSEVRVATPAGMEMAREKGTPAAT